MVEPVPCLVSKSLAEASRRAKGLYKMFLRVPFSLPSLLPRSEMFISCHFAAQAAPLIITRYELGKTVPQVRARITQEFAKHKHLTDPKAIDFLIFKGTTDMLELRQQWKT